MTRWIASKGFMLPWLTNLLLVGVLFLSCVDDIELEGTGGGAGQMVIQGELNKDCPSSIRVRVSRTADFVLRSFPTAVSGAEVRLADRNGNILVVPEMEPGVYEMEIAEDDELISIETGVDYQIRVSTSEGGQYKSAWETIQPVPIADSVSIEIIEREELDLDNNLVDSKYMQFFIHTPLQADAISNKSNIRWVFESVYRIDETPTTGPGPGPQTCFINRGLDLDKVVVFNGSAVNSSRLDGYFITEDLIDYKFALGYLLKIKQQSLSSSAYTYWNNVGQAVGLSGGLFEAFPGEIVGNMVNTTDPEETVLGFFYASEVHNFTRFVTPDESGRPEDFCSLPLFTNDQACASCISIINSTKEVPDGWDQ